MKFDDYARSYEGLHKSSIAASGEDPAYFHDYKIECLRRRGILEGPLLDYGCGTGNLLERFARVLDEVHGYDPSAESLREAKERAPSATLHSEIDSLPRGHFALAVLSGVLHHVPTRERRDVLERVRASLRPGGRIVVFEHNPLNPLTRRAVAMCPFDDDAILLWPWEARRRLRAAGFRRVSLDYIVFFPKPLAFLRRFEPHLHMLAIGAQQMLIGERAAAP
ncbi:MAG: class I SAM-dependent methyltransferase [Labilithrix sp.]|nr:class I SAM-dependent methyltransferase [Labilithrix sp.]MCW5810814.1 class I SAM-dependent methyltransferase [Labilithrix sp.]